jgi:hypothetical protein
MNRENRHCRYDVCLSFAGEDRDYVKAVAEELRRRDIRVFYDKYEEVQLWGANLLERFATVYQNSARYCVMFVSVHYRRKVWPNHEAANALARSLKDKEYILPVRFDDTEIPGLLPTIGYVDANLKSPNELASMIEEKTIRSKRENYFPTNPVSLRHALEIDDEEYDTAVLQAAHQFFTRLRLMTAEERRVVFLFFLNACPAELPDNLHVSQDLLSRLTGLTVDDLRRLLRSISSLDFKTRERTHGGMDGELSDDMQFELQWHDLTIEGVGNATAIANDVIDLVMESYCVDCGMDALLRLDFSGLGNVEDGTQGETE